MSGRKVKHKYLQDHFPGAPRAAAAIGISRVAFYKKPMAHRAAGRMAPAGVTED
jgi:hypothetical protein